MILFYRNIFLIAVLSFIICGRSYAQNAVQNRVDTAAVRSIINEVNQDSVRHIISTLQGYGTRFLSNQNRRQVYKWIRNKFLSYGFTDVTIDSFYCNTLWNGLGLTTQYNVVAKLSGTASPDQFYIIGAHYDSYSRSSVFNAPGADDNASGTAAVLESARVIKKKNYNPSSTLLFIAFAAEELMNYGDSGSEHYAAAARDANMNIKLMINNDMILNSLYDPKYSTVDINYYSGFENLGIFAQNITRKYSIVTPVTGALNQMSDSYPFYFANYPAVYFEENIFSPYYHSASDLLGNYNIPYCTEIIKASCATLISYMESVVKVDSGEKLPEGFVLYQNYPNPFNPETTIKFALPRAGYVTIKIFDMLGREVETLFKGEKSAGIHQIHFIAKNLAAGTYLYQLVSEGFSSTKKLLLLK